MKRSLVAVGLVLAALLTQGVPAFAAGTVTATEETVGSLKKISFAWTSDGAGAADGPTLGTFNGEIVQLVTVPSGGGTAPTALYDVTVVDDDATDVLNAKGTDRSATATEQVTRSGGPLGVVANDKLTIHVTNAGAAKQGTLYIYVR